MSTHNKPGDLERGYAYLDGMLTEVDLTSTPDLTVSDPDTLITNNRQPDVIQTLGGLGGMTPTTHVEAPHPNDHDDDEDPAVKRGLHLLATRYDGTPVRIVPASRMRTNRYRVTAGIQMAVAARDHRRLRTTLLFNSNTATDLAYFSNDQTTAVSMGFLLPVNVPVVVTNGDEIGIAVDAANAGTAQYISICQEVQE